MLVTRQSKISVSRACPTSSDASRHYSPRHSRSGQTLHLTSRGQGGGGLLTFNILNLSHNDTGMSTLKRKPLSVWASASTSTTVTAPTLEQPSNGPEPPKPPPPPAKKPMTKADQDKEASRKFRRNVFSPDDWVKHRSSSRYWRHISTMVSSGNVASLLGPTMAVGGWYGGWLPWSSSMEPCHETSSQYVYYYILKRTY
jgi:hypothetical protein